MNFNLKFSILKYYFCQMLYTTTSTIFITMEYFTLRGIAIYYQHKVYNYLFVIISFRLIKFTYIQDVRFKSKFQLSNLKK